MLEGTGKHSKALEDFQYTYGSYGAKTADCYATKEECLAAERERSGAALKEYLDEITDMESLVLFMYGHEFHSGEYCNEEACAAVEQKMKEFGIKA